MKAGIAQEIKGRLYRRILALIKGLKLAMFMQAVLTACLEMNSSCQGNLLRLSF